MAADGSLNFDTKVNDEGFEQGKKHIEAAVRELIGEIQKLSAVIQQASGIKFKADTSQLDQAAAEVTKEVEAVPDKNVTVTADTTSAEQAVSEVANEVTNLPDEEVTVTVNDEPASEVADEIQDDLDEIGDAAEKTANDVSDSVGGAAKSAEKEVDTSSERISGSLKKVSGGFKKLLVAAGLAVGAGATVKFGKEAVEAAAEVNAANSQLAQTFGELQSNAEEAMERVADSSGILQTRLQGVGTSVYAFARTSGMESSQALGMMEEALQVAADSAAYYDRSLEDTSETLMSFLKGNYANDAALGLSATETTRNAAANKLYGKSFQELSEAQKQLTLLQMVKDANALSGAEGQAAREAEGWENVLGNLKEAWRQLLAVVGQPMLKLAISWVQQLTSALTYLTEKARVAINTLAALFGKEVEDTAEATGNITESVSAQEDLTGAVEDTADAEKKSLAGFDKINTVASKSGSGTGSKDGKSGGATVTPSIKVKDNTLQTSKSLEKFIKNTEKIFDALNKYLSKNFAPSFKKIWKQLSPELDRFGANFKKVFEDIKKLGPPLISYFNGDFTSFLRTFVEVSGSTLTGLLNTFNTVFSDLWNVAAYPMLQSFITDGLPIVTQFAEETWKSWGTLFDELKKSFDMLWADAAVPALKIIAQIWQDTMGILKTFWDKHGKVVFEKFREAIQTTGNVLRNIWQTIFKPVFDKLIAVIDDLWSNHLKKLVANVLEVAGKLAEIALDIYNNFIAPLVNWFVNTLGPPIANVLGAIVQTVGETFGGIIDVVNGLWEALKHLLDLIVYVFKGDWSRAWKAVKDVFASLWNGLVDLVKAPLNAIIGFINVFVDAFETVINFLIDCLNTISIDIPKWVPKVGGKKFGFDFDHVDIGKIPPLAQGTVVPANYGNFLAMLGDNKREPEVVSPLSTMEKAVENALARAGKKDQTIHVHVELDGREIGRVAVKAVEDDNRRKGA